MMLLSGYRVEWMLQPQGWGVTTAACSVKSWVVFLECNDIVPQINVGLARNTEHQVCTIDEPNYCCCD